MNGAIHKVLGTETEYGIAVRNNPEFNPVLASSIVINSYAGRRARIQWSHEEESPGRDARGFGPHGGAAPDVETGLVNVVLSNGARLYVDHAHPEYSSPECYEPLQAALYDKAGEVVMARAADAGRHLLGQDESLLIHKNNSDGKGNSYGAHENYLISRQIPFADVAKNLTAFLVSRQIFTGSGKVGSENGRPDVAFQLTQRADFFEEEIGLETTLKRPIINTRDEPHGDPSKYRRLHVIIGDATMSEVQTYVKLGATSLMLAALEDGALPEVLTLSQPVESVWKVSHDLSLSEPLQLLEGDTATARELQWQYFEWCKKYAESADLPATYEGVIDEWESILTGLEIGPAAVADRLDWAAKYQLLEGFVKRDGLDWEDSKLRLLSLQYHDIDPDKGLYYRLARSGRVRRLFTDEQVEDAIRTPPAETRAYFRGQCVTRYGDQLVAANWDSLVFDVGEDTLKRVPMMEPLRGTKDRVAGLLDSSPDAATLVKALGGDDERTRQEASPEADE